MKLLLLLTCLYLSLYLPAQQAVLTPVDKTPDCSLVSFFRTDDGNYIQCYYKVTKKDDPVPFVAVLDKDLKQTRLVQLKSLPQNQWIVDMISFGSKLYFLVSIGTGDTPPAIEIREAEGENFTPSAKKLRIDNLWVLDKRDVLEKRYMISDDGSTIIFYGSQGGTDQPPAYAFTVMDKNLNVLWKAKKKLPMKEALVHPRLLDDGRLVIEKLGNGTEHRLLVFDGSGKEKEILLSGFHPTKIEIEKVNGDVATVFGFKGTAAGDYWHDGFIVADINLTSGTTTLKTSATFTDDLFSQMKKTKFGIYAKGRLIPQFEPVKAIPLPDGSTSYVSEVQFYGDMEIGTGTTMSGVGYSRTKKFYQHEGVVVFNVKNNTVQQTYIEKYNEADWDGKEANGVLPVLHNNTLVLLYNDPPKGGMNGTWSLRKNALNTSVFDKDGAFTTTSLKLKDAALCPMRVIPVAPGKWVYVLKEDIYNGHASPVVTGWLELK